MGLCDEWFGQWADSTGEQELIDKYKRGIDFAIEHDWPSVEFIKANFSERTLHGNLIFNDDEVALYDAPSGVYIFNGNCRGAVSFGGWTVATVYVRHTSELRIYADGNAKVFVRLYDESGATEYASEEAVVKVFDKRKSGDNAR